MINAVISSFAAALALLFTFIPRLVGFLIILLVGWLVATALEKALTFLLRKFGFDRIATRIGLTRMEQSMGLKMDAAGILGKIVYWFVFLIFLVPAVNALELTSVSNILNTIIAFIPNVFVAILILFLGTLAATFVADIVRGALSRTSIGNPSLLANLARYAIIGFAALIAIEQLGIGQSLLNILFTAIVGALALAFGLAFGLGGRESAQRLLNRSESTVGQAANQLNSQQQQSQQAQQNINQARTVAYTQGNVPNNPNTANTTSGYQQQSGYPQQNYPPNQYPQQ
ncbi:MAG TPA: small-conductance mechanosensitive ion channel [Ktedonobacter sp.]|nr:small-conductance mechanosensitive ion channel [Ktedonobacter sp.]